MKLSFIRAIIILLIFYLFCIFGCLRNSGEEFTHTEASKKTIYSNPSNNTDKTTISNVKLWFENQKNVVASSFENYLNTQTINSRSINNTQVTDIEFKFDRNLGCYYILYFNCKLGNSNCEGHTRAFLRYQEDSIKWWSLEITKNNQVLIDDYDDDYEDIVMNYYNQLVNKYQ